MAELDDIIHQPLRLRIMAALNALPVGDGLEFSRLKKLTGATDGNLGAHIETLAKAGYVAVDKAFVGKKPQTTVTATAGRPRRVRPPCRDLQEIIAASGQKRRSAPSFRGSPTSCRARNDGDPLAGGGSCDRHVLAPSWLYP